MALGEAAGVAAAMSLPAGDIRAVETSALRQRLTERGAVI
jgi:hypothetical protein